MKTKNILLSTRTHLLVTGLVTLQVLAGNLFAQSVAINADGSAPNANAILDISSTSKGVLLPRMTTAQRTAISNVAGMVVFDTDLSDIHHNTGSAWTKALTTNNISNIAWLVTGNTGTNSTSNFLGTTDAVALVFKTNNTERMQINSTGQVGMGASPSSNTRLVVNNTSNATSTSTVVKATSKQVSLGSSANADSVVIIDTKFKHQGSTIEDFIGIKVGDVSGTNSTFRNSGTITNTYGLYIGDITQGTQTNQAYAIYNGDPNARNYIAGNLGIGTETPTEKLDVSGNIKGDLIQATKGLVLPFTTKSANYSLTADDYCVVVQGGSYTMTLPAANSVPAGKVYILVSDVSSGGTAVVGLTGMMDTIQGQWANMDGSGTYIGDGSSVWYLIATNN